MPTCSSTYVAHSDPTSPHSRSGQPAITRADVRELVEHVKAQLEEVEDLPDDVDPERFQAVDGRPLDEGSPAGMLDVEDDPLLLYLYRLKYGGLDHSSGKGYVRYEHMVIDEVQDLSVIEVKLLIGWCSTTASRAGKSCCRRWDCAMSTSSGSTLCIARQPR